MTPTQPLTKEELERIGDTVNVHQQESNKSICAKCDVATLLLLSEVERLRGEIERLRASKGIDVDHFNEVALARENADGKIEHLESLLEEAEEMAKLTAELPEILEETDPDWRLPKLATSFLSSLQKYREGGE